jgi:hypothetical protein
MPARLASHQAAYGRCGPAGAPRAADDARQAAATQRCSR